LKPGHDNDAASVGTDRLVTSFIFGADLLAAVIGPDDILIVREHDRNILRAQHFRKEQGRQKQHWAKPHGQLLDNGESG
jgi:hypothetical protein